jgi:hypothetical protein
VKIKKIKKAKDNEWLHPKQKGFLMGCCDCGLVHKVDFRVVVDKKGKYETELRATRAPKYTAWFRKKNGIVLK